MHNRFIVAAWSALVLALPASARAQNTASGSSAPIISTSARGEAKVTPDRASITLSVQSRAASATDAASENARKQTAVIAALRALAIPDSQIATQNYTMTPETRYEKDGQAPHVVSYLVTNSLSVELTDISKVGKVIDATLNAGANVVSSIDFFASRASQLYLQALSAAVANARAEAEAMARAGGGRLGPLIEVTNNDGGWSPPAPRGIRTMSMAAAAETPIMAGPESITASVTGRWVFVPDP